MRALLLASLPLAAAPALAHPGHGADLLHSHVELLVLVALLGVVLWRRR